MSARSRPVRSVVMMVISALVIGLVGPGFTTAARGQSGLPRCPPGTPPGKGACIRDPFDGGAGRQFDYATFPESIKNGTPFSVGDMSSGDLGFCPGSIINFDQLPCWFDEAVRVSVSVVRKDAGNTGDRQQANHLSVQLKVAGGQSTISWPDDVDVNGWYLILVASRCYHEKIEVPIDNHIVCPSSEAAYPMSGGGSSSSDDDENRPPTASFTVNQDKDDPFTYAFDGRNSLAFKGSITSHKWDFGDGGTGSGDQQTHKYAKAGRYRVVLTVTDSQGKTGTYEVPVSPSPLVVTLRAGVTNNKLFSVEVTLRNAGKTPMQQVAFAYEGGIVDSKRGDPTTAGEVARVGDPDPPIPDTLEPGAMATATVTFSVRREGGLDLESEATATSGNEQHTGRASAIVQIGKRTLTETEAAKLWADLLLNATQTAGRLQQLFRERMHAALGWAMGPDGAGSLPAWLTGPISGGTKVPGPPPPPTTGADLKVAAGRFLGLPDGALDWVTDDQALVYGALTNLYLHQATSAVSAIKNNAVGAYQALANAGDFYIQTARDRGFRAEAGRQFVGMLSDMGSAAWSGIQIVGSAMALAEDFAPQDGPMADYHRQVVGDFSKKTGDLLDRKWEETKPKLLEFANKMRTDPIGASGDVGDVLGTIEGQLLVDVATAVVGGSAVSRFTKAVEGAFEAWKAKRGIDAAEAGAAGAAEAGLAEATAELEQALEPVATQFAREGLETLGENSVLTLEQLEAMGGFYAPDAAKVQKLVRDIKTKYGVDVEIHCRPGNPASLQYYKNGTGVPKPEWIKPKATEWTDVALGAPRETLGRATLFEPKLPSDLSRYTQAQQAAIEARFKTQQTLWAEYQDPTSKLRKMLDASKDGPTTVTVGLKEGQKTVDVRYSLEKVGDGEAYLIKDDLAGGKYVLSDADYQAVVKKGGKHIPASEQRGAIELEVMTGLRKTVSFGGHGWSHGGVDLPSMFQKTWVEFATGSMSLSDARRMYQFILQGELPKWVDELAVQLKRAVTVDDLVDLFKPGQFVIKFNGVDIRAGYAPALR